MYLIMAGIDGTKGRQGLVYFNNGYNTPIRYAIERGVRRVYSGKLVYEVKTRRGFELLHLGCTCACPAGSVRRRSGRCSPVNLHCFVREWLA